jgi:type VI secretion system protein VasD
MLYAPLVAAWHSSCRTFLPVTPALHSPAAARRSLTRLALTVGMLVVAGCASPPPPPPPPPPPVVSEIQLSVLAGADVNPDARKRASPVTVRIYALKSAAPFEAADFFSLFEKDTATLGSELVQREEFLMRPGEQKALPMKFGPEVKAIGVMVAYRDLERARWREVHTIDIGKAVDLKVRLNGSQIALEKKLLPPPPPPAKK